jgi:ArsR family transcriptional regulator
MRHLLSIAKALADPSRLRIVCALHARGELCVCQIQEMLGIAASSTSRHLAILASAGLVVGRREARWMYYRLAEEADGSPVACAALAWACGAGRRERTAAEDRAALKAILALTPEELCCRQAQGIRCCPPAPPPRKAPRRRA